jgi:hypothetical protein
LRRTNTIRIIHTNASEPSLSDLGGRARTSKPRTGALTRQTHSPGQTSTGQRDEHETMSRFHRTRPETHQNLIHPDKEQNRRHAGDQRSQCRAFGGTNVLPRNNTATIS